MYAQKPGVGRGRERAPYATLRQARPDVPDPDCLDSLPLAMVYAPRQAFERIYAPEQWMDKGTIFEALDFPFRGARKGR